MKRRGFATKQQSLMRLRRRIKYDCLATRKQFWQLVAQFLA
jgi:hypothetical protein